MGWMSNATGHISRCQFRIEFNDYLRKTGLPMVVAPRWRTVRYERRTIVSDGKYVDVFIVP